jgi:glycosyltransferase involved in cell wall biosynthesis
LGQKLSSLARSDGFTAKKMCLSSCAAPPSFRVCERIIWLGSREDVGGWLAAMDIFVHTADFEGMPNAVMEAMAMALPVVASNVDGNRELIRNEVSGYLVNPGNVCAFTEQIQQLMDNPDRAHEVGQKAHQEVLERFNMPRMVRAYDQLFVSLGHAQSA